MEKSARSLLGERVRELRLKAGMTQEKLAALTGIDYKYIQKIEGKNPPSVRIDTIEKLAKVSELCIFFQQLIKKIFIEPERLLNEFVPS